MSEGEEYVDLEVSSFPNSGDSSMVAEVIFGPMSEDMNLLITVSGTDGKLSIVIGNSPDDEKLLAVIPALLREVADLFDTAEF